MNSLVWNMAVLSVCDLVAVVTARLYAVNKNPLLFINSCIFFILAGIFFIRSLQYEGVAIVNVLWTSISVILVTLIGEVLFKEHILPLQYVGICFSILGLVLIGVGT